jgi:hypothetical protein
MKGYNSWFKGMFLMFSPNTLLIFDGQMEAINFQQNRWWQFGGVELHSAMKLHM